MSTEINGKKMSELQELGTDIQNNSYFIVRRDGASYKISYQDFLDQLYEAIIPKLHLSSMAFRDKEEYSLANHTHNYTYVSISANPELSNETPFLSCVTYNSERLSTVTVIKQKLDFDPILVEPYIGELNFIYNKSLPTRQQILNNINNGTFDGWVYSDGSTYQRYQGRYDFSEAYRVYNGSGNRFSVPNLHDFIRTNGGHPELGGQYHPYENFVDDHVHSVRTDESEGIVLNQNVQASLTLSGGTDYGKNKHGFHLTFGGSTSNKVVLESDEVVFSQGQLLEKHVKVNATNTGYSIPTENQVQDRETYPIHYKVPAMIYIGIKKVG